MCRAWMTGKTISFCSIVSLFIQLGCVSVVNFQSGLVEEEEEVLIEGVHKFGFGGQEKAREMCMC